MEETIPLGQSDPASKGGDPALGNSQSEDR
jgi:hypothetical protein